MSLQKTMSQFIKDTQISEKKYKKLDNLQGKTGCPEYNVWVTAIAKLMQPHFSILILTKFKNQNLSKAIDEVLKN